MPLAKLTVEAIEDPEFARELRRQDQRFSRNFAVFRARSQELFRQHRGKVVVVAGGELHIAETPEAAWDWASGAHPGDDGVFVHYIPRQRGWRLYAGHR